MLRPAGQMQQHALKSCLGLQLEGQVQEKSFWRNYKSQDELVKPVI